MKKKSPFLTQNQLWLCLTGLLISNVSVLFAQVKLTEESWILPTYKVLPSDKNPVFFKNEVYRGASKSATENLTKSKELSTSNLWANIELKW